MLPEKRFEHERHAVTFLISFSSVRSGRVLPTLFSGVRRLAGLVQGPLCISNAQRRNDAEKERREEGRIRIEAEEWRKEEEMKGQMDGCCNGEWGGERGRLVGMGFASKCMRH